MTETNIAPRGALLLLNPDSGNADANLDAGLALMEKAGMAVEIARPEGAEALAQAISSRQDRIECVIVGGGDGSMNFALPHVLESGLILGVLPMGTANDLARTLGIPLQIEAACKLIAQGHTRRIDIGEVNGRHFFNVAHIGLAVEVARRADKSAKGCLGPLAYPYMAWQAFRTRRTFKVDIESQEGRHRLRVVQVSVGNGRFYGGGVPIAEDATINDGMLDLYALPARKGSSLLALIPAVGSGRTGSVDDIFTLRSSEIHLRTRRSKGMTVDGEEAGQTPAHFRIIPKALSVYCARSHTDGMTD